MDVSLSTSATGLLRTSVKATTSDAQLNAGSVVNTATGTASATTNLTHQAVAPVSSTDAGNQSQNGTDSSSLKDAISSVETFVQSMNRDLEFSLDKDSGEVVVKVVDRSSGNLIRQIPSEDMLKLASSLKEARSLLFEGKA